MLLPLISLILHLISIYCQKTDEIYRMKLQNSIIKIGVILKFILI